MRVLLMGDAHIGRTIRGRSRLAEHRQVLDRFVAAVDEHKPDVVILPGDTFDSARPGPDELTLFAEFLRSLREREVDTLITPGNHDGPTTMRALDGKVTAWLSSFGLPRVYAMSDPSIVALPSMPLYGARFFCLPYPHKRSLDHLVDRSLRDRTEEVSKALENIIETAFEQFDALDPGQPLFFVGHLSVLNAELSEEQAMRLGWDVTIRPEVLDPFSGAFLGHIHRQQQVGRDAWYTGSPVYGDFGETSQTKGFLLYDEDEPIESRWQPIASDCLPMTRINVYESQGWEPLIEWGITTGWVQVRLFPDQGGQPSWGLRRQIRDKFPDASGVWVDVMPRPQKARARLDPAVRTSSAEELLRAYLSLNGIPEDPALAVGTSIMRAVDEP